MRFVCNHKAVTAAGTAETLVSSSQRIPIGAVVCVKAKAGNTGSVRLGETAAKAQDSDAGFPLAQGEMIHLMVNDVQDIYLDADNSGDGVNWVVERA